MFSVLIRTGVLVIAVLLLAQFVPLVAEYKMALIVVAVALGLIGIVGRIFIIALMLSAAALLYLRFF